MATPTMMPRPEPAAVPAPPASEKASSVAEHEHHFSNHFRDNHPKLWFASLAAPFLVTGLVLLGIGVYSGWAFLGQLIAKALIAFFGAGRFIILAGGDAGDTSALSSMTRGQLFMMVTYMDLLVASLLVVHAGVIFKIPKIGPGLAALQEDGEFILKMHPWMRRATFIGLVLFITFPLAATGSVGGAIFGRLLGMSRLSTFAAIFIGSVLGNGVMWLFAGVLVQYINKDNPLLLVGGIVVIVSLIMLLNWRYQQMKKAHRRSVS